MLKMPISKGKNHYTYVVLLHFEHTPEHHDLLKRLRALTPNISLEVKPEHASLHMRQFINLSYLALDEADLIRRLNS